MRCADETGDICKIAGLQNMFWKVGSPTLINFLKVPRAPSVLLLQLKINPLTETLQKNRAQMYSEVVCKMSEGLKRVLVFTEGTFLCIAQPKGNLRQLVVYNGL